MSFGLPTIGLATLLHPIFLGLELSANIVYLCFALMVLSLLSVSFVIQLNLDVELTLAYNSNKEADQSRIMCCNVANTEKALNGETQEI